MKLMNLKPLSRAVRQVITVGGTVGLLGLTFAAQADTDTACFGPSNLTDATLRAETAQPATLNICIRPVHDGRAAVLLPDAQQAPLGLPR
jgi:hypothetical protein